MNPKPYIVALIVNNGCVPPYIFAECENEIEGRRKLKKLHRMDKKEIQEHFNMDDGEVESGFELFLVKRED